MGDGTRLLAIFAALFLAGCATSYQRSGATGGFDDVRLTADQYRISVQGNGYTTADRAEQIMLLRAAELTLQNGFSKFVILEREAKSEQQFMQTGIFTGTTIARPQAFIVIRMLKGTDPSAKDAMDAAMIDADLRPRLINS